MDRIEYDVEAWSSYVKEYHPRNIKEDRPDNQASRWSAASRDSTQFLVLKMDPRADNFFVLKRITFGKFHLPHVCNLKEFEIYVSLDTTSWRRVLHAGLRNDTQPESFPVVHRFKLDDSIHYLPSKYVKIVPIASWGASFNFGIWHVSLLGSDDATSEGVAAYTQWCDRATWAATLPFLRRDELAREAVVEGSSLLEAIEARLVPAPVRSLAESVRRPPKAHLDPQAVEAALRDAKSAGLLRHAASRAAPIIRWTMVTMQGEAPGPRGGHQMVIDVQNSRMILFGGWDGTRDLSDLWAFDLAGRSWTCLSEDTAADGGPTARSVHRCAIDSIRRFMYVLGHFGGETEASSDFYRFHLDNLHWERLSVSTREDGGPGAVYDQQMVVDESREMLWVFGGKHAGGTPRDAVYSGLWSYDIRHQTWRCFGGDAGEISGRVGHLMFGLFEEEKLVVMMGRRHNSVLGDIRVFDTRSERVCDMCLDTGALPASFTHRGVYVPGTREFVVLSCGDGGFSVFVHHLGDEDVLDTGNPWGLWTAARLSSDGQPLPPQRYAYQWLHDPTSSCFWLFGGTSVDDSGADARLNDLWQCILERPSEEDVFRSLVYRVRCAVYAPALNPSFEEKTVAIGTVAEAERGPLQAEALRYLQTSVVPVAGAGDGEALVALPQKIFLAGSQNMTAGEADKAIFNARQTLLRDLVSVFNLSDQLPLALSLDSVYNRAST